MNEDDLLRKIVERAGYSRFGDIDDVATKLALATLEELLDDDTNLPERARQMLEELKR